MTVSKRASDLTSKIMLTKHLMDSVSLSVPEDK